MASVMEETKIQPPAWATAAIIAELIHDDSDPMTDYFGEHTTKTVLIGWRKGNREDFRQLRAAAASFPETAHLGPGKDCWRAASTETRQYIVDWETGCTLTFCGSEPGAVEFFSAYAAKLEAAQDAAIAEHGGWAGHMSDEDMIQGRYTVCKESVEHRENYSMGKGNYLQTRASAWRVSSESLGRALEQAHVSAVTA